MNTNSFEQRLNQDEDKWHVRDAEEGYVVYSEDGGIVMCINNTTREDVEYLVNLHNIALKLYAVMESAYEATEFVPLAPNPDTSDSSHVCAYCGQPVYADDAMHTADCCWLAMCSTVSDALNVVNAVDDDV